MLVAPVQKRLTLDFVGSKRQDGGTGSKLAKWQTDDATRLKSLWDRRVTKVTQAEFAARYDLGTQSMVWQYLSGHRPLNIKAATAFARELRVRVEEISPTLAKEVEELSKTEYLLRTTAKNRGVPVVGTAQLGPDGHWLETEHPAGFGDGQINLQSADANAYAVRVIGDSMHPRIKSGEFVVVEPNHAIVPGDEVLVVTTDGRRMVKEFLRQEGDFIFLNSVNDQHGRMTLHASDIDRMQYVAAVAKSGLFVPA